MNAPVMVELEGETDPLEVKYYEYLCEKSDNYFIIRYISLYSHSLVHFDVWS